MTSFYKDKDKFYIGIDCIIFGFSENDLSLLILKRDLQPAKGCWSLPGGFLEKNENLHEAARRVLAELTGLNDVYMEQLETFGEVQRDPGERVVSVAYYALIDIQNQDVSLLSKYQACWVKIGEMPDLIFDHNQMVEKARITLRNRAAIAPIGFNLLPDKFTMSQFQSLYEAIYSERLDKRNFRKKILKMNILEKLDEKDKSSSKRGAYFFRFNIDKYNDFINKGYNFTI